MRTHAMGDNFFDPKDLRSLAYLVRSTRKTEPIALLGDKR